MKNNEHHVRGDMLRNAIGSDEASHSRLQIFLPWDPTAHATVVVMQWSHSEGIVEE